MIPANAITAWGVERDWSTREQVEQDLLLSRAICAIADDDYLSSELVFRVGRPCTNSISIGPTATARISTMCGPLQPGSVR